jgi:two-component system NtrC family sensor kinase
VHLEQIMMTGMVARILIIDDEHFITEVLQRALEKDGYSTQAVQDGQQAAEALSDLSFDLILCDLELPGTNGLALYKNVVDLQPSLGNRFVFMTGEMLNPDVQDFLSRMQLPLLMKPFDLNELLRTVEATLNKLRPS